MDNQPVGNVHSDPHLIGDPSKVKGPDSDGSFGIPVRALNITWGNDPRYWELVKFCETESKLAGFEEGVALQQVNWLQVTGKFELVTFNIVPKLYKVYYMMKFNEDAFGWNHAPIKFKVKLEGGSESEVKVNLHKYREKPMMWHKVYVGEFNVVGDGSSMTVEVGMFEVETDWWKGGAILGGVRIEPEL
ncbi:protein PHLOEM PROTEIN 2-LIKE A1-like [Salvia hispanica]|uniref:protein PHLOEM PROTEIN 2-LIKE A1-like n=1 Tax=Salvia hispanica TaxID=49212 RepID=UPI0020092923|nr:protein PHLOEM PROTEIN 2-LIKE A1-like [Salvia hispanica]